MLVPKDDLVERRQRYIERQIALDKDAVNVEFAGRKPAGTGQANRHGMPKLPVRLTGPRRLTTGEFDVNRALVERDLPVDIFLTAFDEVVLTHEHIVSTRRGAAVVPGSQS